MADIVVEERPALLKKRVTKTDWPNKNDHRTEGNIQILNVLDFEAETMCCRFSPFGKFLAVGLSNGVIKIYSTDSKAIVYVLPSPEKNQNLPVTCIRWKPITSPEQQTYGNIILVTYASGEVRRWHISTGQCLHHNTESSQLLGCSLNKDASRSVVSDSDGKIILYDEEIGKKLSVFEPSTNSEIMDGHTMRVFVVQYHPHDNNVFVSGGWDDTVQWWDTRMDKKHSIKKIFGPHICGEGLDIEPNTMLIVTASWRTENNLQVFDYGTGKEVQQIKRDFTNSMLYCAQWKNRDSIICGGSHEDMMRIVDLRSSQTIGRVMQLPGAVYSVDNSRQSVRPHIALCADRKTLIVEDTL